MKPGRCRCVPCCARGARSPQELDGGSARRRHSALSGNVWWPHGSGQSEIPEVSQHGNWEMAGMLAQKGETIDIEEHGGEHTSLGSRSPWGLQPPAPPHCSRLGCGTAAGLCFYSPGTSQKYRARGHFASHVTRAKLCKGCPNK